MNELESLLTGAPAGTSVDPVTDKIVRTVYGEAANQDATGRQAVAAVIMNRARAARTTPDRVITPDQFEPWSDPKAQKRLAALSPSSPAYQAILSDITPVLQGQVDPTGGADHFYAPKAQAALGRPKPAWDNGSGQDIGDHRFFKLGYQMPGQDDLMSILGSGSAPAAPSGAAQKLLQSWAAQGEPEPAKAAPAAPPAPRKAQSVGSQIRQGIAHAVDPNVMAQSSDPIQSFAGLLISPQGRAAVGRGAEDVVLGAGRLLDPAVNWISQNVPGAQALNTSVGHALGMPTTVAQAQANRAAELQAYNAHVAQMTPDQRAAAGRGRSVGQSAALMPVMAGVNSAVAPVANALTKVVPATEGVVNFLAGNATGNPLARILSGGVQGAIQGGEAGALLSGSNTDSVAANSGRGAALGGVLGAAVPAGAEVYGALKRGLPFTAANREAVADKILRTFAEGGPTKINASEIVPGSTPSLAEATANPGIAGLERSLRNSPQSMPAFAARDAANAAARENALNAVIGDKGALDDLIQARSSMSDPVREAAFASHNAFPTDPTPAIDKIDEILQGPAGQRDIVKSMLGNIRSKLAPDGHIQTDPAQLYGVRQAIGDMLDAKASGELRNAQLATRELMDVRKTLDDVIESGAPGYKGYMKTFAQASKPINEQEFLQGLNLTDSKGNITLGRLDSAIKRIDTMRAKPGANDAKAISDDTLRTLNAVRDDLRRAQNLNLGRSVGSNTVQNMLTGNAAQAEGAGAALSALASAAHGNPLIGVPVGAYGMLRGAQANKIQDILTQKLLEPSYASSAFAPASNAYQLPGYAVPVGVTGLNRLVTGGQEQPVPARP